MEENRYLQFCTRFFSDLYRRRRKDLAVIQSLSHAYASMGDRKRSFLMDKRYAQLDPLNPIAHYNLACDFALNKHSQKAIKALKTAFTLGYDDFQWIRDDIDLDPIRHDPQFRELLEHYFIETPSA